MENNIPIQDWLTIQFDISKKGKLSYVSWADAWEKVLHVDPAATFEWHDLIIGPFGGVLTKVSVTIQGLTRTMQLPVMDHRNNAIAEPDVMAINKAFQRCTVKCIALFGLGLYVYRGEDLPEAPPPEPPKPNAKRIAYEWCLAQADGDKTKAAECGKQFWTFAKDRLLTEDTLALWREFSQ